MTATDNPLSDGTDRTAENRCQNCDSFVTKDFARVFGNNQNEVHGCLDCIGNTDVKRGGARSKDATSTLVVGREPLR